MKQKWIDAYLDVAERFAQLSSATRLQVGAVVVKDNRIISIGYNGMPAGWDNECEHEAFGFTPAVFGENQTVTSRGMVTRPEVIHAERNALDKLARSTESGEGADMFVTHAPCMECAKSIYNSGISSVYYRKQYRSDDGIDFLKKCGVTVHREIV